MDKSAKKNAFCNAPFVSISISITGFASCCCYMESSKKQNRFPENKLMEIWTSEDFNHYRYCFTENIMPDACSVCRQEIAAGNTETVLMKNYDRFAIHPKYPRIIEITTDNLCNLECIMCRSKFSSRIAQKQGAAQKRIHNEALILAELNEFIPFLDEVIISGGEPFLSPLSLKLMQQVIHKNPRCTISVNTNGTILTDEIKDMMEKGMFNINLSLDSITKSTYEKIRVGAHFESVMEHLMFFATYLKKRNSSVSIPVCPLRLNCKEIPELVSFCNKNSFHIVFVHVFKAHEVALYSAAPELLQEVLYLYESCSFPEDSNIHRSNAAQFCGLINNVRCWLTFSLKKEAFIKNLIIEESLFSVANKGFEMRVKAMGVGFEKNENTEMRYERWKSKKDKLLSLLPLYFHHKMFFNLLFDIPPEKALAEIEARPMDELKENFIAKIDNIIRDKA